MSCFLFSCCGKRLCHFCYERTDPFKLVEKQVKEIEQNGGFLSIQDPGPRRCPNCNALAKDLEGRQLIKDLEKLAKKGVIWAMDKLSIVHGLGKYGNKKKSEKARQWLLKAAKEGSDQSLYHLGDAYWTGGSGPWGNFKQS